MHSDIGRGAKMNTGKLQKKSKRSHRKSDKKRVESAEKDSDDYPSTIPFLEATQLIHSDGTDVNLTAKQKQEIRSIFDGYDTNQDGSISKEELAAVMRSLGFNPTSGEVDELVCSIDLNKNGIIDYYEFELAMSAWWYRLESQDEELLDAFRTFDRNGDGFISVDELRQVAIGKGDTLSAEEAEEMISIADADKDGQIDYKEFVKMMTTMGGGGV